MKAAVSFHPGFPFLIAPIKWYWDNCGHLGIQLRELELGMHLVWANRIYLCGVRYTHIILHERGSRSLLSIVTVIGGGTVPGNSPAPHRVDSPGGGSVNVLRGSQDR